MPYEPAGQAQTQYPTFPTWDPTRLNGRDFLTDLSHWWTQTNQAANERGALFGLNTANRVNAGVQPGVDLLRTMAFAPEGHEAIFRLLDRMGLGYLRPQYGQNQTNPGQPGLLPPQTAPQIQFGTHVAGHGPTFGAPTPNYQGSVSFMGGVPHTQFVPPSTPGGANQFFMSEHPLQSGQQQQGAVLPGGPSGGFLPTAPRTPSVPGQRGGGTGGLHKSIPTSRPTARRR